MSKRPRLTRQQIIVRIDALKPGEQFTVSTPTERHYALTAAGNQQKPVMTKRLADGSFLVMALKLPGNGA